MSARYTEADPVPQVEAKGVLKGVADPLNSTFHLGWASRYMLCGCVNTNAWDRPVWECAWNRDYVMVKARFEGVNVYRTLV